MLMSSYNSHLSQSTCSDLLGGGTSPCTSCRITKGHRSTRDQRAGFTLVELLAVIMIIAVLGGIVLGIAGYAARRSEDSRARADLQLLRNALEEYRLERGAYPAMDMITLNTWEAELGDFTNQFVDLTFMDPWGEPYQFRNQGRFSFDLYSMGPTGESEEYDWIR